MNHELSVSSGVAAHQFLRTVRVRQGTRTHQYGGDHSGASPNLSSLRTDSDPLDPLFPLFEGLGKNPQIADTTLCVVVPVSRTTQRVRVAVGCDVIETGTTVIALIGKVGVDVGIAVGDSCNDVVLPIIIGR